MRGGVSISILSADIVFDVVRYGMMVKKAVSLAIAHYGASGGGVRTVIVSHHVQVLHTRFISLNMYNKLIPLILNLVDKLRGSDQEFPVSVRSTSDMTR